MKLTVLVDNNTLIDRYLLGEPALAIYIEDVNYKILFDVGYSDVFIKNSHKLNIDLYNLDYIVISHSHLDHTWGLESLIRRFTEARYENITFKKPTIITHPKTFLTREFDNYGEIGSMISEEKLSQHFNISLTKEPYWLTENIVYLGQIPRKNSFEKQTPIGSIINPSGNKEIDFVTEDSALAFVSSKGLVVITGCSHSGICNIIEHAKHVCKTENVLDIIGGLHLLEPGQKQITSTIDYFSQLQPAFLHACHCTDMKSKIALSKVVNLQEVGVGMKLEY
ncbi:MBL fold metallo-hydrolase [bacterium]|nr:MBL fold metallo-hydrolase [bacterium]MBU1918865.1 MBL fold metallo-hydrolase [bacterium]